jgi:pentatricopeptide repeat protein
MLALCSDGTRSVDRACRVLSLCRSMGVAPNRRSLLILIEGLARDGQVEPAYQFHKELMSREWNPDQKPYGRLVSALCNAGHVGRAVRVVEYMDEHGVRLPVASLGSLVAGCARTGRLPMALEMYDQVKWELV